MQALRVSSGRRYVTPVPQSACFPSLLRTKRRQPFPTLSPRITSPRPISPTAAYPTDKRVETRRIAPALTRKIRAIIDRAQRPGQRGQSSRHPRIQRWHLSFGFQRLAACLGASVPHPRRSTVRSDALKLRAFPPDGVVWAWQNKYRQSITKCAFLQRLPQALRGEE